jgi:hypothetical protein
MAIKGKGKSKRRGVSAAPKPVYVQPKRPILSRRGFWIGVGIVVVVAAVVSVTIALLVQHHNNQVEATKKAKATVVRGFGTKLDTAIASVGQGTETAFQAFPDLAGDLEKLKSGDLSDKDAIKAADDVTTKAASAAKAVQAIPASTLVGSYDDLQLLVSSQNQIAQALQLYGQVGAGMKLAAGTTGKERSALIANTQALLTTTNQIFGTGYGALVSLRVKFGVTSLTPAVGGAPSTP